nr:hypothetical protein CFP56_19263 [Quercus suber]
MAPFVGSIDVSSTAETTERSDPPRVRAHILPQSRDLMTKPDQILSRAIYISNSRATVERLKTKQAQRGGIADVATTEWFAKKAGRSVGAERTSKDWLWADDNADRMLAVLREEVSYRLKRVTRSAPIASPPDVTSKESADHAVCLLKIRENTTAVQHIAHAHIFDLTALLDPASLDAVIDKQADWRASPWVAVNKYDHSVGLTLALLKLEQYTLPLQA